MQHTTSAPDRAHLQRSLFGSPALRPRAPISATATGSLKLSPGPRVVEVDVMVDGLVFTCLVRGGKVVGPMHRGQNAVRFVDRSRAEEAYTAAVSAARDAELAGWLHV